MAAGVAVLTFVAFVPSLLNQFVDWDDPENFLANPSYRGLGWTQLKWMWTTFLLGHWVPASWMTLGLDYVVWGMNPVGYHLTNVLLHTANSVVFYLVALRLLRAAMRPARPSDLIAGRLGAALVALLFAAHPLRVESVAWVTERRDVLSGLFYLLAVWAYLRDAEVGEGSIRRRTWYWLSIGCFALALLSKAIALTLPIVLVVLDVYPLRRLRLDTGGWWSPEARRRWLEKVPFILASAAVIPITLVAARAGAHLLTLESVGALDRLAVSLFGLTFYPWKTVVPLRLSPFYQLMTPITPFSAPYVLSGLVVAVITLLSILLRRRCPGLLAVWIVYVVTVLPVSGILQNGPQITADRYSYLPSLSLVLLAGAGILQLRRAGMSRRQMRTLGLCAFGAGVLVVTLLVVLTWRQVGVWRDSERLWLHALEVSPSSTAYEHLGYLRRLQGRLPEAIEHYRIAASLAPRAASIRIQWGNALAEHGMLAEAIDQYQEALRLASASAGPHYHWANALFAAGRLDEAFAHYREAVRIDPTNAEAQNSWGRALAQAGKWDEAIARYQEAVRLKPHSIPHYNWGNALFAIGRFDEAIVQYQETIRMDPSVAEAHNNWGRALAEQGKWEEAITRYREALRIRPNYPLAAANLDQALSQLNKASTR